MRPLDRLELPSRLQPSRALLHPVWLGSLAVLALNDHVLKGSGLLPGVVTGKLSDFAGMLVAPLLLATLFGVRDARAWLLSHLAVGLVFSSIQLSVGVASLWSAAMGLVGFPWVITSDPSDLIALPVLALSQRFFPRVMGSVATSNAKKAGQWAAAMGGLACTVATSPPSEPPRIDDEEFLRDIYSDVYLHNGNEVELVVRIRPLADSVDVDCAQVASDPGRLLTEPLFGNAQSWTVRANANVSVFEREQGISDLGPRECWAALVDADNLAPIVLFWMDGQPAAQWISGAGFNEGNTSGVSIFHGPDGRGEWTADRDLAFNVVDSEPRPTGWCAPAADENRILWSDDTPLGDWVVGGVEAGVDGCYDITLLSPGGSQHSWYLCVPNGSFPFVADDAISIANGGDGGATIRSTFDPEAEAPDASVEMLIVRGSERVDLWGLNVGFVPEFDCGLAVASDCGTVVRPGRLVVSGEGFEATEVHPGEGAPARLLGMDGTSVEVFATRVEERFAVDAECSSAGGFVGTDVEFVAVRRGE